MIADICAQVLDRITPSESDEKALDELTVRIIAHIDRVADELNIDAHGLLVGSVARDTWIVGEKDVDIFITFPEEISREDLESIGLQIAKKVATDHEERYAEHPYIRALYGGYNVDIVPCFRVSDPSSIKSAVDRTPFHNKYLRTRIKGLEGQVRLLKQFMKGVGVYGSELRTKGFSGYLCELLVLKYGSFLGVLESASDWKRGVVIDLEGHGTLRHEDPLVIIDPVDPSRNVAAAVSLDNFCMFIDASREFLKEPSINFFFPPPMEPITDDEIAKEIQARKTDLFAIVFQTPNVVEDILYPQLYKAVKSVEELLHRNDFRVFRGDIWSGAQSVILLEMEVAKLPNIKKHIGPPVESSVHSEKFKAKYANPYIKDGRYVAEIPRKYTKAKDLLLSQLNTCGLGKNVSEAIGTGYKVLKNRQIAQIEDREFRIFLRKFFKS
ncbi:MAG: CCA tRNA nucleotidyltransferase [Methanocellales archaeon]|nr:CCA tRNA nucleotidyltransferase [Methanocellales archaeon]MDD3292379.1 CCA tRNA nucleotidyltransferase [Methanocellales archaeon]MDD5235908.1 CCA tRNA nucleotidyltransferase [Methanocellales archaeon]MDD5485867.1 CCA tRNA nucleotidyltransferase [Methanocellales archaeon]